MWALTHKLLNGSDVTPKTHPVLVSLLDMAGQPVGDGGQDHALGQRLNRQWKRVGRAFRAVCERRLRDRDLLAALPFEGLAFDKKAGWSLTVPHPLRYRELVAAALESLAGQTATLRAFDIRGTQDLRDAQRANRIVPFDAPASLPKAAVITRLMPGRRLVVAREINGERVWTGLEADEFGRVKAICHESVKRRAIKICKNELKAPKLRNRTAGA